MIRRYGLCSVTFVCAGVWWLRAAYSGTNFYAVNSNGGSYYYNANGAFAVPLGFSHVRQSNHKAKSEQEERRRI